MLIFCSILITSFIYSYNKAVHDLVLRFERDLKILKPSINNKELILIEKDWVSMEKGSDLKNILEKIKSHKK